MRYREPKSVEDALKQIHENLLLRAQNEMNPRIGNAAYDRADRLIAWLDRRGELSRIATMLEEPIPSVRCYVAAKYLFVDPAIAIMVLREVHGTRGYAAFNAGMCIEEFEAGRMTPYWRTKYPE